jgi:hypothetical protein
MIFTNSFSSSLPSFQVLEGIHVHPHASGGGAPVWLTQPVFLKPGIRGKCFSMSGAGFSDEI